MLVNLDQITLAQLRFVCAIADGGTFRGAAKKCEVSQPTLSIQIQKLEEALSTKIFDRQWQPVQLTAEGQEIVAHAKVVLFDVEKFASRRQAVAESLDGDLRIGIIPTLTPHFVSRLVTEFVRKYPGINLTLKEGSANDLRRAVERNELDLGLMEAQQQVSHFIEVPLFKERYMCYLPEGHPLLSHDRIRQRDLDCNHSWPLVGGHGLHQPLLGDPEMDPSRGSSGITVESGSLETLKRLVNATVGYALLPELAISQCSTDAEKLRLRRFVSPEPERTIVMVHASYFHRRTLLAALKQELISSLPPSMQECLM